MTIEEKLQHFYDTSVAEAQTEAENTLEAHKKSLEEMFEKHKESRKMDAGAGKKSTTPKPKRHAKKQNQEKRMPEPGKSRPSPKHKRHAKKQNQEKGMPEPVKSRQTPSTNGMPKSKIEKKGCQSREKASNPQA